METEIAEKTQWDDVLVKFGIKESTKGEMKEEEVRIVQKLEEHDSDFDDEDEEIFRRFRETRLAEMKMQKSLALKRFGHVEEIAGQDFVQEVNKAGDGIYVVLHLYKPGFPTCTLINGFLTSLASKFPLTKFLKSISTLCIPNFPDHNLPGLLVYKDGSCVKQLFGAGHFSAHPTVDELEWMLSKTGAIKSELEQDPRKGQQKGSKFFMATNNDSDSE